MALGILVLGIPPTFEEFARMVCFLLLCLVYIAFWLNLGILFSVVFRQVATSALSSMAVWLFFNLFYSMIVEVFAKSFLQSDAITSVEQAVGRQELVLGLMRLSPSYLFNESTTAFFAGRPNARDRHGGANGRRCYGPLAILAKFAAHLAAGDRAHCRHSHLLCDRVLVVYEAGDTGEWVRKQVVSVDGAEEMCAPNSVSYRSDVKNVLPNRVRSFWGRAFSFFGCDKTVTTLVAKW